MSSPTHRTICSDLVSVVIPMYNARDTIDTCIKSALGQDYTNIEIIVVDDGSTDGSLEVIDKYSNEIQVIRTENRGPASARNNGVKNATGEWIALLDSDDVWHKSKINIQLRLIGNSKWSYTDSTFWGGANNGRLRSSLGTMHEGSILTQLILNNFITTSTVMISRELFLKKGGFDETISSVEDWDLWLKVAEETPISYVNQSLAAYRVHSSSLSRDLHNTSTQHIALINKVFSKNGVLHPYNRLYKPALSNALAVCAQLSEEEGNMWLASKLAVKSAIFNSRKMSFAAKMLIKSLLTLTTQLSPSKRIYSS